MLTSCAECGNQVSTLAATCPKCGAPVNLKPTTIERTSKSIKAQQLLAFLLLAVGIVVAFIGSAGAAAVGALIFIIGAVWLIVVAVMAWWKNG